jgi:hypothetical protein
MGTKELKSRPTRAAKAEQKSLGTPIWEKIFIFREN